MTEIKQCAVTEGAWVGGGAKGKGEREKKN